MPSTLSVRPARSIAAPFWTTTVPRPRQSASSARHTYSAMLVAPFATNRGTTLAAANHLVNCHFRDMLQFLFPRFAHILPFLTGAVQ